MAGLFMQIFMSKELKEGLEKMKYVLNHSWKFDNVFWAFLAGFCQTTTIILVTMLNYYAIIANDEVIEIVMNFLALAAIAELDDFFFVSHSKAEPAKEMVLNEDGQYDDLYTIQTTTSDDAYDEKRDHLNTFKKSDADKYYFDKILEKD